MAKEKYEIKGDKLIAETDIRTSREDGRKILIARAGQTVSLKKATELGFSPEAPAEKKSEKKAPAENKKGGPAEDKSKAPAEDDKAKK